MMTAVIGAVKATTGDAIDRALLDYSTQVNR